MLEKYEENSSSYVKSVKEKMIGLFGEQKKLINQSTITIHNMYNRIMQHCMYLRFVIPKTNINSVFARMRYENQGTVLNMNYCIIFQIGNTQLFTTTSANLMSQDGEYKHRFVRFNPNNQNRTQPDEYFETERNVVELINSKKLILSLNYHGEVSQSEQMLKICNEYRFSIIMLANLIVNDRYKYEKGKLPNHINPAWADFIKLPMWDYITPSIKMTNLFKGRDTLTEGKNLTIDISMENGVKLFPLSYGDLASIGKLTQSVWFEVYVQEIVNYLILEMITPCVGLSRKWFIIKDASNDMFDNSSMYEKLRSSELAVNVSSQLDRMGDSIAEHTKKMATNRFFKSVQKLNSTINTIQDGPLLSGYTLCLMVEHTGETLRDTLISSNDPLAKWLTSTPKDLKARVCEIMITFLKLHKEVGIIHTDAHPNNLTVNVQQNYFFHEGATSPYFLNNVNLFQLAGQVYMFPYYGYCFSVIDYSRSILINKKIVQLEHTNKEAEIIFRSQAVGLLRFINRHFPKLVEKNKLEIEVAINVNPELVGKVICPLDVVGILTNLISIIESDSVKFAAMETVKKEFKFIVDKIESHVVENLKKIFEGIYTSVEQLEWFEISIIENNFREFLVTEQWNGLNLDAPEVDSTTVDRIDGVAVATFLESLGGAPCSFYPDKEMQFATVIENFEETVNYYKNRSSFSVLFTEAEIKIDELGAEFSKKRKIQEDNLKE
jgi:hypothetical protein